MMRSADLMSMLADESRGAPITIWIIGDLDSAESRAIIEDGLIHLQVSRGEKKVARLTRN